MLGVNPSIKMAVLGGIFKYVDNKSIIVEALEEYTLAYIEADYEYPGKHATMEFMASRREFCEARNSPLWLY